MRSPCSSPKHQEYSCMMKWGVTGFKFTSDKWCHDCLDYYKEYLQQEDKFHGSKSGRKGKAFKKS